MENNYESSTLPDEIETIEISEAIPVSSYVNNGKKKKRAHMISLIILASVNLALLSGGTVTVLKLHNHVTTLQADLQNTTDENKKLQKDIKKLKTENEKQKEKNKELWDENFGLIVENNSLKRNAPQQQSAQYNVLPSTSNNQTKDYCQYPDCSNTSKTGSFYCSRHTCLDVSCNNPKANDFCMYCEDHKCMMPDCNLRRERDGYYCYSHKN